MRNQRHKNLVTCPKHGLFHYNSIGKCAQSFKKKFWSLTQAMFTQNSIYTFWKEPFFSFQSPQNPIKIQIKNNLKTCQNSQHQALTYMNSSYSPLQQYWQMTSLGVSADLTDYSRTHWLEDLFTLQMKQYVYSSPHRIRKETIRCLWLKTLASTDYKKLSKRNDIKTTLGQHAAEL